MDVDPFPWLLLVLSSGLVFLASAAEMIYAGVDRGRVRELAESGDGRAWRVEKLLANASQLLLTTMLLRTAGLAGVGASAVLLWPSRLHWAAALGVVLCLWLGLAALQVLGRAYVQPSVNRLGLLLAPFMQFAMSLLAPLSVVLRLLGAQARSEATDMATESIFLTEDGLRLLINVRNEADSIEEMERQMIASILNMEETVAREVMVPRIDLVALDVATSLPEALDVIIAAGHSRIPVYEENIDRIVGFLYAKDLLSCFRANDMNRPIRDLLRPAYFVPVTKTLDTLFREMQKRRVHIAVVVDEYGGTAGLLTIEDILEEIVGDIQDEYDPEAEVYVQSVAPDAYVLHARLDLDSLAELLHTDLPDGDADTLGGLLYSLFGHVPDAGETVMCGEWLLTVLTINGRRIEQVRAEHVALAPESRAGEPAADAHPTSRTGSLMSSLSLD